MKQKLKASFILALFFAFTIVACKDKKKDEPAKTDATKTETTAIPDFDPAMDATKTAGYPAMVLADSLNLKAYEFVANPGDTIPMHAHPDHMIYVMEGGTAEIKGTDGNAQVVEFKKGACMISGPQAHAAKNTGTTPLKLLIVHCYRPRG